MKPAEKALRDKFNRTFGQHHHDDIDAALAEVRKEVWPLLHALEPLLGHDDAEGSDETRRTMRSLTGREIANLYTVYEATRTLAGKAPEREFPWHVYMHSDEEGWQQQGVYPTVSKATTRAAELATQYDCGAVVRHMDWGEPKGDV